MSPSYPVNRALGTIAFGMRLAGKQFESIPRFEMADQSSDCQPHLPLDDQRPSLERVGVGIGDRRRLPPLLDHRVEAKRSQLRFELLALSLPQLWRGYFSGSASANRGTLLF